jgi:hypothetical protein
MSPLATFFRRVKFRRSLRAASRRSTIILSAGMPRSGSTWLFNAARLLLNNAGRDVGSGWIGDWATLPKKMWLLLKVHDYDPYLVENARIILYSFRDLRDALASSKRKFGTEPTMAQSRHWLEADRQWRQQASFVLRYESMLTDATSLITDLTAALQLPEVDSQETLAQIARINTPNGGDAYDPETLLHPDHITDGRHGTWQDWLAPEFVRQIEEEFRDWFEENGYSVDRT